MQRHRATAYPASPKNVHDITVAFTNANVRDNFGKTKCLASPQDFFITAGEEDGLGYCIFASKKSINLMEQWIKPDDRKLCIDATFKVTPNSVFYQTLIIFVEYHRQVTKSSILAIPILLF